MKNPKSFWDGLCQAILVLLMAFLAGVFIYWFLSPAGFLHMAYSARKGALPFFFESASAFSFLLGYVLIMRAIDRWIE